MEPKTPLIDGSHHASRVRRTTIAHDACLRKGGRVRDASREGGTLMRGVPSDADARRSHSGQMIAPPASSGRFRIPARIRSRKTQLGVE